VKAWRKAHARIRNQTIEELVQERMVAEKLMPITDRYSVDDFIDPETPPSLPFASGQRLPGVRRTRRCLRAPRTGDQGRDRRRHPR
jgi:hypothetical protein